MNFIAAEFDLRNMVMMLGLLGLMPFLLAMTTPFVRLVIVGGLLRQALGLQQVPPNSVITGMALVLTLHIMAPVVEDGWQRWQDAGSDLGARIEAVHAPLHDFLANHARAEDIALMRSLRDDDRGTDGDDEPRPAGDAALVDARIETLTIFVPAFLLSELRAAFLAGVLIFIGFLVVDLVVGNILLTMGMHMLSPVTVSLPLKIALFVFVDGWQRIIVGLVSSY